MRPVILLVGTADTKADELRYLQSEVDRAGGRGLVMDVGVLGSPGLEVDVDRHAVAASAGLDIAGVAALGDENHAMQAMARGAAALARDLVARREIDGCLAIGGTMGTDLALEVMAALPLGTPKVVVSSVAHSHLVPPERLAADLIAILWPVAGAEHRLPRRPAAGCRRRGRCRAGGRPGDVGPAGGRRLLARLRLLPVPISASPRSSSAATRRSSSTPRDPAAGRSRRSPARAGWRPCSTCA